MNTSQLPFDAAYIFGCGLAGLKLRQRLLENNIRFLGFIDSYTPSALRISDVKFTENTPVLVSASEGARKIGPQLEQAGARFYLLQEMARAFPQLDCYDRMANLAQDYDEHRAQYESLKGRFADEVSEGIFDDMVLLRRKPLHDYEIFHRLRTPERQYELPELLALPELFTLPFVDCGAFTGDSAQRYLELRSQITNTPPRPDSSPLYLLEPDPVNLVKARENLAGIPQINFLGKGAWDQNCTLSFAGDGTATSSVAPEGKVSVECVRLDDVIEAERAFIKMDIEGAEPQAIKGATRLIRNGSPLAVCLYHSPSHLWEIPKLILDINPALRLYLRHYTDGWDETVLYALPPQ